MVIVLQICLFLIAFAIRGRYLFGKHLQEADASNRLRYIARNKNKSLVGRHVGITQHDGITFIIKPERFYHRLFKLIGIASEIKIPDKNFDKKYFVISDYPNHLERIVASGQLLSHLQELFALPIKSLHATKDKIWCVIKKEDLQEGDEHYKKHAELLEKISACTNSKSIPEYGLVKSRNLGMAALIFVCFHAGFLGLGIFGALPTLLDSVHIVDFNLLVIYGLITGGVFSAVWLFIILAIFNKTSWICWVLADFVLSGIIGFVLAGSFIVREANQYLPQPPAKLYEQPIIQKSCTIKCSKSCGKRCTRRSSYPFYSEQNCDIQSRSTNIQQKIQSDYICKNNSWYEYKITVKSWKETTNYSFKPEEVLFDSVHEGGYLNIPVNKGALGLEWIDQSQIKSSE